MIQGIVSVQRERASDFGSRVRRTRRVGWPKRQDLQGRSKSRGRPEQRLRVVQRLSQRLLSLVLDGQHKQHHWNFPKRRMGHTLRCSRNSGNLQYFNDTKSLKIEFHSRLI